MNHQRKIKLTAFTEDDIDRLVNWIPSSEFLLQWAGPKFNYPLDREQLVKHLLNVNGENPDIIYKAVNLDNGEVVGHAELVAIDRQNLSASVSRILVGLPELRGQGIGKQVINALLKIAFHEMGLHRISLYVFDFNNIAIRCYRKAGFKFEGILRDARKYESGYWNLCVMSILENEWSNPS